MEKEEAKQWKSDLIAPCLPAQGALLFIPFSGTLKMQVNSWY